MTNLFLCKLVKETTFSDTHITNNNVLENVRIIIRALIRHGTVDLDVREGKKFDSKENRYKINEKMIRNARNNEDEEIKRNERFIPSNYSNHFSFDTLLCHYDDVHYQPTIDHPLPTSIFLTKTKRMKLIMIIGNQRQPLTTKTLDFSPRKNFHV